MRSLFRSFNGTQASLAIVALSLCALALTNPDTARAETGRKPASSSPQQPKAEEFSNPGYRLRETATPSLMLDENDELATLHAIHIALQTVGDGGAYIWHREHGLLDGLIRPTTSFKAADGSICRHIVIELNSGEYSRKAEGIACQDAQGRWSLAG